MRTLLFCHGRKREIQRFMVISGLRPPPKPSTRKRKLSTCLLRLQGEGGEQSLSKWESRAKHGITLQFLKGRTYLTSTFAHGPRDNLYLYFSTRLTPMDELLGLPKQRRCLPSGPGGKIFGSWNSMWAASVVSRSWLGCVLGCTLVC